MISMTELPPQVELVFVEVRERTPHGFSERILAERAPYRGTFRFGGCVVDAVWSRFGELADNYYPASSAILWRESPTAGTGCNVLPANDLA